MLDIALIFPGQGAQEVGMGKELYQESAEAKAVFDQADHVIEGLSDIIFNGSPEKLTSTAYCQPAIFTYSMAALKALQVCPVFTELKPLYTCGLSLGECTAVAASGALDFEDGLKMIQARASFMEIACQQSQGSMAAVIGLDKNVLTDICSETGIYVANFNSPEQIVVSGETHKVDLACSKIKEAGAKRVIPLTVGGAFHSPFMESALTPFEEVLNKLSFKDPLIPLVSNVDAQPALTGTDIKRNLIRQITSSVLWVDSINFVASNNVKHFIEIGPGNILKGLVRKIDASLKVFNVRNPGDLEKIVLD